MTDQEWDQDRPRPDDHRPVDEPAAPSDASGNKKARVVDLPLKRNSESNDESTEESGEQDSKKPEDLPGGPLGTGGAGKPENGDGDELSVPETPQDIRDIRRRRVENRMRQKAYYHKRREQKKLRVLYRRLAMLTRFCFFVLIAGAIWLVATHPFWQFDVPRFDLRGGRLLSADNLQPIIADYEGRPIYEIDPAEVAGRIRNQFGIVGEVAVRRAMFPARLAVFVTEKRPVAELYNAEDAAPYALLAADDSIVPLALYRYRPVRERPDVLLPPGYLPDAETAEKLQRVIYQLRHVPGLHFSGLRVEVVDQAAAGLVAEFDEATVLLGRPDLSLRQRMNRLPPLVPTIHEMADEIRWVDLRWNDQVNFKRKPAKR